MILVTATVTIPQEARRVFQLTTADLRKIRKGAANGLITLTAAGFRKHSGAEYWAQAADSIETAEQGETVFINIMQRGVRLHWRGGTVRPGKGRSSKTGKTTKRIERLGRYSRDSEREGENVKKVLLNVKWMEELYFRPNTRIDRKERGFMITLATITY